MDAELLPCPRCRGAMTDVGAVVICVACDEKWRTDTFNTLARRAEIGRLVEEMAKVASTAGEAGYLLRDICRILEGGPSTLFDALRALAAEIGGKDVD